MLKTAVIGAGHLGKIHLQILKDADFTKLSGFYDINESVRADVAKQFNIKAFSNIDELLSSCDIVDIVTPTPSHFDYAKLALESSKHIFIEKPVTSTIEQSNELIKLAKQYNVKIQVGHVERYNPAYIEASKIISNPLFVETHRLAIFNPRGTDDSVVLDLMIHDIDILLSIVKSPIRNIYASGVNILSDSPDIANARIEFENSCVANLTASRISLKNMRKTRVFQKDAYVSIDFLDKKYEVIKIKDTDKIDPFLPFIDLGEKGKKQINIISEKTKEHNAIEAELRDLVKSITDDFTPIVDIYAAQKALSIAIKISDIIKKNITSRILHN